MADTTLMDKLVSLCKRQGFVFQSSEIYGGLGSVWDYGPLGVELKKNVKDRWWHAMVHARDDIEGIDAAILMAARVWEASGHVAGFTAPWWTAASARTASAPTIPASRARRVSRTPNARLRQQGYAHRASAVQPHVQDLHGSGGRAGRRGLPPSGDRAGDLRQLPERAPELAAEDSFGIAQIGKAFRNEITPGNFIFRTREFEQMEMQFFVKPGTDAEWFERWREWRMQWHHELGLNPARLRWHQHGPDELAHYARAAFDVQYEFPFGWQEIEGIHNRGDFDLGRHQEYSGKKLDYFEQATNERFIPYIVETSAGADRVT